MGFIKGSINIPLGELRDRAANFQRMKHSMYPARWACGYLGARILQQNGISVKNMDGEFKTYSAVFKPVSEHASISESGELEILGNTKKPTETILVDCSGLQCPGPIMQVYKTTMSMDIMGIKPEELIVGVDNGGVASYLGDAEESGLNLII